MSKLHYTGVERRVFKPSPLWIGLCALGVGAIAFATLCPIGLRPHLASANTERFGAYFVLGVMLALAAPRRWRLITSSVVALAFALEAGQLLVPGRDAVFQDAVVKALGGALGAGASYASYPLRRRIGRRRHSSPSSTIA